MKRALPELADLPAVEQGSHRQLGPLDVHIWVCRHGADGGADEDAGHNPALLALLSPDERERVAELRDNRRRQRFVIGRTFCRRVLSHYAPVRPQDWRFKLSSRGKPSIAAPALSSPLWFSLSHVDGVSVCAVTGAGPEIGIDIERTVADCDALDIAEQFFQESEVTTLRHLLQPERNQAFVQIWALKESFVKAHEISLSDGLCGVSFDLASLDDIRLVDGEPLSEMPARWRFKLLRLDSALICALAVQAEVKGVLNMRFGGSIPAL